MKKLYTFKAYCFLFLLGMPAAFAMEPGSIETSESLQECQICFRAQPFLAECVHCRQSICRDCAYGWIKVNESCPYCRQGTTTKELHQMFADMTIFVRTDGATITLHDLGISATIDEIKQRIKNKTDIPEYMQRLTFSGKQLEDSLTLSDYNIEHYSSIRLKLLLSGD